MSRKIKLSITLDSDLIEIIRKNAAKESRSISNYLNHYLRLHLAGDNSKHRSQDKAPDQYLYS